MRLFTSFLLLGVVVGGYLAVRKRAAPGARLGQSGRAASAIDRLGAMLTPVVAKKLERTLPTHSLRR